MCICIVRRMYVNVCAQLLLMEGLDRYIVACAHIGNGTGRSTATLAPPLLVLLTSGLVRYEARLHSCGTSPVGQGGNQFVTVRTHGDFIVLPQWDIRLPAP